jgi:hypothetical protein
MYLFLAIFRLISYPKQVLKIPPGLDRFVVNVYHLEILERVAKRVQFSIYNINLGSGKYSFLYKIYLS